MPLFEYQCRDCGAEFEKIVFDRGAPVACRTCSSTRVSQLLSTFAVGAGSGASPRAAEPGPCGTCGAPERGSCSMN